MTPDAVYHNVPIEPVIGHEAIREAYKAFFEMAENVEFEVRNIGSAGSVVFAERVDHFDLGGAHIDLPCCGVYEIVDGKIAAWRDYFDVAMFNQQHSMSEAEEKRLNEAHGA
jgi:limonene-1,2-epoxide hydrolase